MKSRPQNKPANTSRDYFSLLPVSPAAFTDRLRVACLALAVSGVAGAATYYVDPSGSDWNSGSPSTPFRTVAKGVSVAGPGDTVILNNGTYGNEGYISDGTGCWNGCASPVTIQGRRPGCIHNRQSCECRSGYPGLRHNQRLARVR